MTQHLSSSEQLASAAFENYARERRVMDGLVTNPAASADDRVQQGLKVGRLWKQFLRHVHALDVEMTPEMERERARLTCEAAGIWLAALFTGIVMAEGFLPAVLFGAPVAWWARDLTYRYAAHIRDRAGL